MDKSRRRHDKPAGLGMGGRLRQRLAQILLHTSCAATTTTSATTFVGLATTTHAAPEPPLPPARRGRPRAGVQAHEPRSSSRAAVGDGSRSSSTSQRRRHHHLRRREAGRALVHISIDCSTRSSVAAATAVLQPSAAPVPPTLRSKGKKGGGRTRLPTSPAYGYGWSWLSFSSSSADTDVDGEAAPAFSSDVEGEEESGIARSSTLFPSRSFSSDLYGTTNIHGSGGGTRPRCRKKKKPPPPQPPRRALSNRPSPSADAVAFRPQAGEHGGKKKHERKPGDDSSWSASNAAVAASGSTAVVKRSRNPYADFRSSMVEMVAGRRIRGADALSELLVLYLSLNSPRHHPAILAAFEDVWEAILGSEP